MEKVDNSINKKLPNAELFTISHNEKTTCGIMVAIPV